MSLPDPFSIHRGENLPDLSFPADMKNVPLFPGHADASRDILGELLLDIPPQLPAGEIPVLPFMY